LRLPATRTREEAPTEHRTGWQEAYVTGEREAFLRGLIHSDGCRIVANDRGNPSVRYHFSNLSEDIKGYCKSFDALRVHWIGPKR
jgi:hypothetical protein